MEKQLEYEFIRYVDEDRWDSYYRQIKEILDCNAKTVLLIGVGDGLIPYIMRNIMPSIEITTFDIDKELDPDICGDIRELSFLEGKYDAVVCCQVLEHLPFQEFEKALKQLRNSINGGGS